ncbi:MAG: ZIP family metal transporter [Coriobacteriales bacterium]
MGLLITFVLGIFVLIGAAIAGLARNEHRVSELSVAVALGAIVMLLVLDLLPETFEGVEHIGWVVTVIAVILGFAALALLDRFLPDSDHGGHGSHGHDEDGEAHSHTPVVSGHPHGSALHVSVAVVIALTVHNVIEGMSVYGVATQSVTAALLLAFGIGIHNMPMGMIIYAGVRNQSLGRRVGILAVAALSTFVGGLLMFAIGSAADDHIVHFMIALTVGLLLYIVICELAPHALRTDNAKLTIAGLLVGAGVVLLGVTLAGMA